jgi:hypothetical protein
MKGKPVLRRLDRWRIAGTYYESCNCQAVCPCRRQNGKPGGRSTYGLCQFLLSWHVMAGAAENVDLSGLIVAMAGFYDDDEAGSPWRVILYLDERANDAARAALEAIFLGKAGGNILFTAHIAEIIGVRNATIALDHRKGKERIEVSGTASAAVERPAEYSGTVTCGIPGHNHIGEESISRSTVSDATLQWSYSGRCGFATDFDYRSEAMRSSA